MPGGVLSQRRIEILRALKDRNKTLSELSRELGLSKATLFRHLAVLQSQGIVRRVENGNRFVYYKLSQKGREILEVLLSAVAALTGSVIAYLSAHRLSTPELKDVSAPPPSAPAPTPAPTAPAGGFLPEMPGIGHGETFSSTTSPAAAAILAFLFIFVIVLLSLKLAAMEKKRA